MATELETELLVAREAISLIQRRPNYFKMVVGLYLLSLFGSERGRIMRASYFPVRLVDDLLDGDAKVKDNPLGYVEELKESIATNSLGNQPVEKQLKYALNVLESKASADDNPRADFVHAIDAIIFDYHRSGERRVLTSEEIEQYYREAFDPVINITLLAMDSSIRSKDVPALSYGQGRVYSLRDFNTDWNRGIINIPQEILSDAGFNSSSPPEIVQESDSFKNWKSESLSKTKPDLVSTQNFLKGLNERQTYTVCNGLIASMLKYINIYDNK